MRVWGFGVWRLAFGVWRSASVWKGTGQSEWAIVVPTGFEGDGAPVGLRSLITFGYSGDGQVPHRKGVEQRFLLTGSWLW